MLRSILFRSAAGIAAAPLALAGLLAGASPAPASTTTCQAWTGRQPPGPPAGDSDGLGGVAVVSACNVWAVGGRANETQATGTPLIDHWTGGSSWKEVPVPLAGDADGLSAVSAVSATDIWAVGTGGDGINEATQALIEHWNGKTWRSVSAPSQGAGDVLSGVTALSANNVWAVGSHVDSASNRTTLILHWNGQHWTRVASPSPEPGDELNSVDASSATNIWAVGAGGGRGITEHWDGHQWTAVANPIVGKGNFDDLESVSVLSPGNAWAVGMQIDTTDREALIEHWNGTRWAAVKSPVPGSRSILRGVDVVSASDIWAVGIMFAPTVGSLTLHWDGKAWHTSTALPGAGALFAVSGPAGNVWGVGTRKTTSGGYAAKVKGG